MTLFSLRKHIRLWLSAAILVVAVNASAQTSGPAEIPPDALVPNQEFDDLFDNIANHVQSGGTFPLPPSDEWGPVDAVILPMFERGERVANWSRSGVDLYALLGAQEGGLQANGLSTTSPFGPSALILTDEPFADVVLPDWRLLWSHGAVEPGRASAVVITRLSPKVILVERVLMRRQEQAWCRERAESRLYMDPGVAAAEFDTIAFMMSMRMLIAFEDRLVLCSITVEIAPGVYRDQVFDPGGHRMPAFDAEMPAMRIVRRENLLFGD